jgi:hypothetical protein
MKIAPAKSLKEGNRVYVGLIVIVNALLLYAVAQESTISIIGLKALFTESTNLLPVGFALIVTTVANGLLSADTKGRLVFLRWKHTLPGHRAFSKYAASDPRIDMAKLKKACGSAFPDDPVDQNRTWYRLYKTVEGNPSVLQVQRDFLLMRDYAGLAALFVVAFGAVALVAISSWRVSLTYCLFLLVQFVLVRQAASTYGARFVTTVMAETAATASREPMKKSPQEAR